MSSLFLQLFLLLNVFLIGVLATVAVRHAYAHFRPPLHEVYKTHPTKQVVHLPPEVRERLLEAAQANFQNVLDHSAKELQHDLETTSTQLNKQLDRIGSAIVGNEMERYQTELEQLRKQAEAAIGGAQIGITEHQAELKAKLAEEMVAEQQRLVQQIDTKLADSVASFLTETLQHNVDLGAQTPYLLDMLEAHKTDLKKEVTGEA